MATDGSEDARVQEEAARLCARLLRHVAVNHDYYMRVTGLDAAKLQARLKAVASEQLALGGPELAAASAMLNMPITCFLVSAKGLDQRLFEPPPPGELLADGGDASTDQGCDTAEGATLCVVTAGRFFWSVRPCEDVARGGGLGEEEVAVGEEDAACPLEAAASTTKREVEATKSKGSPTRKRAGGKKSPARPAGKVGLRRSADSADQTELNSNSVGDDGLGARAAAGTLVEPETETEIETEAEGEMDSQAQESTMDEIAEEEEAALALGSGEHDAAEALKIAGREEQGSKDVEGGKRSSRGFESRYSPVFQKCIVDVEAKLSSSGKDPLKSLEGAFHICNKSIGERKFGDFAVKKDGTPITNLKTLSRQYEALLIRHRVAILRALKDKGK